MNISNRLIDYKMVYFKTSDKCGDIAEIIFNQCKKEAEKFENSLKAHDTIIVYDYNSAPFGIQIQLYAYEK